MLLPSNASLWSGKGGCKRQSLRYIPAPRTSESQRRHCLQRRAPRADEEDATANRLEPDLPLLNAELFGQHTTHD